MINTDENATKIIGIVRTGATVMINQPGHPFHGASMIILGSNGATGGIGGGGAVMVDITGTDEPAWISRYTRVMIMDTGWSTEY